jgi:CubicO group peptidase (beta-lactamase class C family)
MRIPWQTIVQPTVEEILRTSQVPGIVIALTKEDGPVEHLVLGTDGQARPLRAETLFPVASITKLATALAILHLAAGGMLRLDDPLERPFRPTTRCSGGDFPCPGVGWLRQQLVRSAWSVPSLAYRQTSCRLHCSQRPHTIRRMG